MKKNLLVFCVSVIVSCTAAEIILRYNHSYETYNERASRSGYVSPFESRSKWGYGWDNTHPPFQKINGLRQEYSFEWTTNNEGLPGKDVTIEKKGVRIMIFGDSFTESMGAPADSTYPLLLQDIIRQSGDSTTEVINCGTAGADVFTEYKLLIGKMLKYQPDIIVVTFNSTDLYDYSVRGGFERFKPDNQVQYRTPPWFEPLYAKSYLVRLFVHDIFNYDSRFLKPYEVITTERLAIENTEAVLDSFRSTCLMIRCKFGMVFHPTQPEYKQRRTYESLPVIKWCKKQHIPCVDNFENMKQAGITNQKVDDYYWPTDGHYKPKGYELLARCAYQLLLDSTLLTTDITDSKGS